MQILSAKPGIMNIKPYVGGEAEIDGLRKVIKLSSNEGALGPSPMAVAAYREISETIHRYPDGNATKLRKTIGEVHGINPNMIVCGSGSDELISLLCRAFSGPGDEVLHTEYGFLMYPISAMASGATPVRVKEINLTANVDLLLKNVTNKTKLLFLANPNNPTGTYIPKDELVRLREGLRDDIILVVDAAYAEYVTKNDYIEGNELVDTNDNVIITRTFSKSHGLGGVRLGWAYGSPFIVDIINRIRGPFNVSSGSQAAGTASMLDEHFANLVCQHNLQWLAWTRKKFLEIGLRTPDSAANFLLVSFKKSVERNAEAAEYALKKEGILVRTMKSYGLPNSLRITIGLEEEMRSVVNALTRFMGQN